MLKSANNKAIDKNTLKYYIEDAASRHNCVELRFKNHPTSKQWSEFVADVIKSIKAQLKFSRGRSPEAIAARAAEQDRVNAELNRKLEKIASIIQDAWSQAFPDGDPLDIIIPKMRRLGIDTYDVGDWLNKAARRIMGYRSYNDFLEQSWNEFKGDNPDKVDDYNLHSNPWTTR